jgi:hypothetical protein
MATSAPDSTEDWLLPERSRPPTIAEIERRVEMALTTARASEATVVTVGAAALEAAEQARRAAELAEKASAAALAARVAPPPARPAPPAERRTPARPDGDLDDFSARADRLVARLRQLQRLPLAAPAASGGGVRRQSAR